MNFRDLGDSKKCYHCGKIGHIKKNCYSWQRRNEDKNGSEQGSQSHEYANFDNGWDNGEVLLVGTDKSSQD